MDRNNRVKTPLDLNSTISKKTDSCEYNYISSQQSPNGHVLTQSVDNKSKQNTLSHFSAKDEGSSESSGFMLVDKVKYDEIDEK